MLSKIKTNFDTLEKKTKNIDNAITEHPRIRVLRQKLDLARENLLSVINEWYRLNYEIQPQILYQYDLIFGEVEKKIALQTKISAKLERKIEIFAIKIQRGEKLTDQTIDFVNKIVDKEFEKKDNELKNNFKEIEENQTVGKNKNNEPNSELTKIYRKLVKILHPDVSGENEIAKKYWFAVQDSYQKGNLQRLKLILESISSNAILKDKSNIIDEEFLLKEINKIQLMTEVEKRRIERMKLKEPLIFSEKLKDSLWIKERQKKLKDRLILIEKEIQTHERMLKNIIGNKEFEPNRISKEEEKFQEDFYNQTYGRGR